jgi:hypothetical protein
MVHMGQKSWQQINSDHCSPIQKETVWRTLFCRVECTYLLFIPHGSTAKDGHFSLGLILETLQGVALWTKQLAYKIELQREQET